MFASSRYYLQQQLGANVSNEMKSDYAKIDWHWLNRVSGEHFGPLTTNVLFIGQSGFKKKLALRFVKI